MNTANPHQEQLAALNITAVKPASEITWLHPALHFPVVPQGGREGRREWGCQIHQLHHTPSAWDRPNQACLLHTPCATHQAWDRLNQDDRLLCNSFGPLWITFINVQSNLAFEPSLHNSFGPLWTTPVCSLMFYQMSHSLYNSCDSWLYIKSLQWPLWTTLINIQSHSKAPQQHIRPSVNMCSLMFRSLLQCTYWLNFIHGLIRIYNGLSNSNKNIFITV